MYVLIALVLVLVSGALLRVMVGVICLSPKFAERNQETYVVIQVGKFEGRCEIEGRCSYCGSHDIEMVDFRESHILNEDGLKIIGFSPCPSTGDDSEDRSPP